MQVQIREFADFYDSPRGQVARLIIAHRLRARWSDLTGRRLLGFGYATPYLRPYLSEAERVVAAMPETEGAGAWPQDGRNLTTLVEEDGLPFPDASFDCILIVHGLELAEATRPFLRELWRVLTSDGRLMVVVPNRTGLWAHMENSPFGHGQPFSRGQLERLLEASLFKVEFSDGALYMPPIGRRSARTAAGWDRLGKRFWPRLGGVYLMEATKSLYALPPLKPARARHRLIPAMANR
jgi:SAM-dependent methyltransferase